MRAPEHDLHEPKAAPTDSCRRGRKLYLQVCGLGRKLYLQVSGQLSTKRQNGQIENRGHKRISWVRKNQNPPEETQHGEQIASIAGSRFHSYFRHSKLSPSAFLTASRSRLTPVLSSRHQTAHEMRVVFPRWRNFIAPDSPGLRSNIKALVPWMSALSDSHWLTQSVSVTVKTNMALTFHQRSGGISLMTRSTPHEPHVLIVTLHKDGRILSAGR
ncbi:hypothetical protein EYF80_032684 [Liparis tanakae]|uniref:Uncharacterized protein n=1 Tax=Liparis tanakae TaxID=230148 RepID=A0A4Z2GUI5_9TELE|nr:hypothetical protein EYF80_032684 [Liparis tanakae]